MAVARKLIVSLLMITFVVSATTVFAKGKTSVTPVRVDQDEIESSIGSRGYVVMDRATGKILTEKNENMVWPIASLTKLMTASIVLDAKIPKTRLADVRTIDNVGGAQLFLNDGDTLSVSDLFYSTLIASANNAANALARTTGLSKEDFVIEMNARAKALHLTQTKFVDPTGIESGNVSTPLELAQFARTTFARKEIQTYTTTAKRNVRVVNTGIKKKLTNTNWMLWKPQYNNIWVTGGKTGYLEESGWNLIVNLKPTKKDNRELLIVLFGASSRANSFFDAKRLSDWAWSAYKWQDLKIASE